MGCAQSKPPPPTPVALCRERSALLGEAIRRRFALADAHRAYAASLESVGAALHEFLNAVLHDFPAPPPQPALPGADQLLLPAAQGGDADDDGEHIRFPPVSDQEDDDGEQIQFPSVEDEDGDGHIQFPSDEDTTDPALLPQLVQEETDDEEFSFPPSSPAPFPSPPYGYAPPYTAYAYGGAETGAYYGPVAPPYAYGGGAYMGPGFVTTMSQPMGPSFATAGTSMMNYEAGGSSYGHHSFASSTTMMNYALSQPPPPSVAYEHRPQVTDATVRYHQYQHHGSAYSSGGGLPPPPPQTPYSSSYGSGSYPYQYPQPPPAASSYHQQPPMPPPSPPKVPSWDFVNPFETFESSYYYPQQLAAAMLPNNNGGPSWATSDPQDDDEVDDDMPELEEDDDDDMMPELEDDEEEEPEQEVIGEANADVTTVVTDNANKWDNEEEQSSSSAASDELMHGRKSMFLDAGNVSVSEEEEEEEEECQPLVRKSSSTVVHAVLEEEEQQLNKEDSPVPDLPPQPEKVYNDDAQVVQEIKAQFDRASKSAGEMCMVLEVGKVPHSSGLIRVPSMRMICALPSTGKDFLEFEREKAMERGNLSSTLQELYMWEKKLLEEVKAEEKIRVQYDEKFKEVKYLYNKGAEAHKLQAVQMRTRKLSIKISVAMQAIRSISNKINKLRDEELWPQTHELIQGFMQMWHTMSECHQMQCHALSQATGIIDSNIAGATFSEAHIDLVKQLELQLLDMTANFAEWFSAQKSYVSTLNEWLKKGIEYVPEVTDDGVAPFSPGRLGAPPVFTICNNWATSIARISEVEVVDAMQDFSSNVLGLWERHRSQRRQGMVAADDKDRGRELRMMRREELSMHKAVKAQNRKLVRVSSQGGGASFSAMMLHDGIPHAEAPELQSRMHKIFEAMEDLAAACANAFKDLHLRCEEEKGRVAQEKGAELPDRVQGSEN